MNNQSEQIDQLATALAKAQSEIRNASEDKINPHYKSKYANLASLWDACRQPLSKNGLSISQTFDDSDNKFRLITILMHCSGQWIKSSFPIIQSVKVQETGSATTYARRYSLSSIVGIAPGDSDDDDGEKDLKRDKNNDVKPIDNTSKYAVKEDVKPDQKLPEVSKEQVDLLMGIIKQCPQDYRDLFYAHITKNDIQSEYDLPLSFYNGLLTSAKKQLEKIQKDNESKIKDTMNIEEEKLPF